MSYILDHRNGPWCIEDHWTAGTGRPGGVRGELFKGPQEHLSLGGVSCIEDHWTAGTGHPGGGEG